MHIDPKEVLNRYRAIEDHTDKDTAALMVGTFAEASRFKQEYVHAKDPVAGSFFHVEDDRFPGLVLEVVGQLDDKLSYCLYKPNPAFATRQAHLDCRVD